MQTAQLLGHLAGVPQANAEELRENETLARRRNQVTAAALSPDGKALAVMTYSDLLLYSHRGEESWAQSVARRPRRHELPWLPQAEALDWAKNGRNLFATGEFSPAPRLYLTP